MFTFVFINDTHAVSYRITELVLHFISVCFIKKNRLNNVLFVCNVVFV